MIDGPGAMAEQMKWINPASVLLAITFSPYGKTTAEAVQAARDQGGQGGLDYRQRIMPAGPSGGSPVYCARSEVRPSVRRVPPCVAQTLCVALGYQRQDERA
ncbi:MAG: hypothetical protein R3E89_16605 [Thiolinea sp.]